MNFLPFFQLYKLKAAAKINTVAGRYSNCVEGIHLKVHSHIYYQLKPIVNFNSSFCNSCGSSKALFNDYVVF